jgi:hypothetical protein
LLAALGGFEALWASRTTPDGSHLVFQSAADLTGYDGGGPLQAYRYSAGSGDLECVSCRRDGQPAVVPVGTRDGGTPPLVPHGRTFSVISDDGGTVFFSSVDPLAPGANAEWRNFYEWRDGQITLLNWQVPGSSFPVRFAGVDRDGASVFMTAKQRHSPWDVDGKGDLYVARVGGGLPPPPEPVEPCDPLTDGSCQGPPAPAPAPASPRTTAPSAGGNVAAGERAGSGERVVVALRRPSRAQRRRAARSGVVRLRVRSNRAGVLRVLARARVGGKVRRVGRASKRLSKPGAATVRVKLNRHARKRLRGGRRLTVLLQVRSPGARPKSVRVALRRAGR